MSALRERPEGRKPKGISKMDLIQKLEQEEIARLNRKIPVFAPGDTVIVKVTVVEGDKKREQAYEGVVIAKRSRGLTGKAARIREKLVASEAEILPEDSGEAGDAAPAAPKVKKPKEKKTRVDKEAKRKGG
jgi:hypothetical protein